jgi:hypothetical protein
MAVLPTAFGPTTQIFNLIANKRNDSKIHTSSPVTECSPVVWCVLEDVSSLNKTRLLLTAVSRPLPSFSSLSSYLQRIPRWVKITVFLAVNNVFGIGVSGVSA